MKKLFSIILSLVFLTTFAYADGYDLAVRNTKTFPVYSGSAVSGDYFPFFDASDDKWKLVDATTLGTGGSPTFTNIDAGASGTAGTVDVFPTTASKGKLAITSADNTGNTTTTLVNAEQAGARTYTIPDAGASASFAMTEGTQTINGAKTLSNAVVTGGSINNAAVGNSTAASGAFTTLTASGSSTLSGKLNLTDIGTVAAAGSAQGDATALTAMITHVTASDGAKGVVLPTAVAGKIFIVYDTVATSGLNIYPASGDDINDGTTDVAITIEGKTMAIFVALDATTWAAIYTANS
jgi:hypothetical protein